MIYRVPETLEECDEMSCNECYYTGFVDANDGHCIIIKEMM